MAVTGALLHDIGKIEAYEQTGGAIELSDAGKLQGEIPLGYYRVRREIDAIEGFPPDIAQAVLHIVLSHHGKLEHGSPVTPCTREATLVHMIDNLGGTLGSFDRIEKSLADGERWSGFDRALSGSAYFGSARRGLNPQIAGLAPLARGPVAPRILAPLMAKDTEKLIRQLSLISFLMAERRPVSALEIRQDVEGYAQMTSDEAFNRRFYADRAELSSLGHRAEGREAERGLATRPRPTRCRRRTSTCRRSSSPTRS